MVLKGPLASDSRLWRFSGLPWCIESLEKIILVSSGSTRGKGNSRRQAGQSGAEGGGRMPRNRFETPRVHHRQ
ncbi:hypothetical protein AMELA_G00183050 [Ameiurus melas]|uniref:Uncharacterized protein n=1 Tax=Ameiurus melas TaxID=219545 RepID=A0A7J6AB34_AMEME|nr:hypothetical protein AMELA_G00183050 [Ameiurus melas]